MSPTLGKVAGCIVVSAASVLLATGAARAQASGCGDLQKHLLERKTIAERLSAGGKKQIDPKFACAGFNQLVKNGDVLIKWSEANKDWCQIPDSFIQGIKVDNGKAVAIRGKACSVAAKVEQMQKNGGNQGAGTLLGGNGLSGNSALPQGAL